MQPPAPFPQPPGPPPASPASVAAAVTRQLAARGITGIYTATTIKFAVISDRPLTRRPPPPACYAR